MLALLTPRVIARSTGRYRQLELDEAVFSRSRDALADALQGGKRLTRGALYALLDTAGVATAGGRGLHILGHLAQEGLLCFGPREGKQPTLVLLDEWVRASRVLEGDEALSELAARYFAGHGPATLRDFVWWSGLTVGGAKAGLEGLGSGLAQEVVDGKAYWFAPHTLTPEEVPPMAYPLPFFDEFLVGYRDRSAALDPAYTEQINAGGGLLNPTVVVADRVVGTWKRTLKKDAVEISLRPFAPFGEAERRALDAAARRYRAFLGVAEGRME